MSSIDKDVKIFAEGLDSRITVRRTNYSSYNGRIQGYIGNELVFDIADRYGVLRTSEREEIRRQITNYKARKRQEQIAYQQRLAEIAREEERRRLEEERRRREEEERRRREEEERRRREEEERRRREAERQNTIATLRSAIANKDSEVKSNTKILEQSYKEKSQELKKYDNQIKDIKNELKQCNTTDLENEKNKVNQELEKKYDRLKSSYQMIKNNIKNIDNQTTSSLSTEMALSLLDQIRNLNTSVTDNSLSVNESKIKAKIDIARDNISRILSISQSAGVVSSELTELVKREFNNVNITDYDEVLRKINHVNESVEEYKSIIERRELEKIIEEMNKLEASLIEGIKMQVVEQKDTYSFTDISEDNRQLANEILQLLQQIGKYEFKVTTHNLANIQKFATQSSLLPQNSDEDQKQLNNYIGILREADDKGKQYLEQYNEFLALKKEMGEHNIEYTQEFDCDNYLAQFHEIDNVIADSMHTSEIMRLCSVCGDIEVAMNETGYDLLYDLDDGYSIEAYYVNKKYPGVLTRVITDSEGNIRRSLVGVKLGDKVELSSQEILNIADKMEDDVADFLNVCPNITGIIDYVAVGDADALAKIEENGYVELSDENIIKYNEYIKKNVKVAPQRKLATAVKVSNTANYREEIRKNAASTQRKQYQRAKR